MERELDEGQSARVRIEQEEDRGPVFARCRRDVSAEQSDAETYS